MIVELHWLARVPDTCNRAAAKLGVNFRAYHSLRDIWFSGKIHVSEPPIAKNQHLSVLHHLAILFNSASWKPPSWIWLTQMTPCWYRYKVSSKNMEHCYIATKTKRTTWKKSSTAQRIIHFISSIPRRLGGALNLAHPTTLMEAPQISLHRLPTAFLEP